MTNVHDFHATMLHSRGLDDAQLTWNHNQSNRRLTAVHGKAIGEIAVRPKSARRVDPLVIGV